MGSADEIMQMCRLCLVKDQVNIPIFDEPTDIKQTFLKISSCLPVKVSREDNLPKKICDDCSYKLDVAYQFRNTSSSSEKQLIQLLEQFGIPPFAPESRKSEISVKLENVITEDGNICPDTQNYILQQQKLPYQQSFAEFGEASSSDAPPRKRAKRASATSKKSATATSVQEILTDPLVDSSPAATITKAEEDSNDSDDMVLSTFASASATSANDQAGPSGVGKGNIDAPAPTVCIFIAPQEGLQVYKDEEKSVDQIESLMCYICNKSYFGQYALRRHNAACHADKIWKCEICPMAFVRYSMLRGHMIKHSDKRDYVCDICEKTFKTEVHLKLHKKRHVNEFRYRCDECGKGALGPGDLKNHILAFHRGVRYNCEICGKTFKSESYLKIHIKSHDPTYNPLRFPCKHCKKSFSSRVGLQRHEGKHTGNLIRYVCSVCGKSFASRTYFSLHEKAHTHGKQFVCEFCGKKFGFEKYLKLHLLVHTKEKPHGCKVCNKRFSQRTTLTIHMRSHTGERPYKCNICSKGFVSNTVLKNHKCKLS